MKDFSIKIETESLVNRTKSYLPEVTPNIARDIFLIIKHNFHDEYIELCRLAKKETVNQWIGKAIATVFNLRHKGEHVRITENGHLIKSYTIFYQ